MTPLTVPPVATASGWLALLQEADIALKTHALGKLLACVDVLWHEVAEALSDLEGISEDEAMPKEMRQTAAAVASRVFFSSRGTFSGPSTSSGSRRRAL